MRRNSNCGNYTCHRRERWNTLIDGCDRNQSGHVTGTWRHLPYSLLQSSALFGHIHVHLLDPLSPSFFFLNMRHISAIMSTVITCNPFWSMLPSSGGKSNRVHFERQLFIYGRWEKIGHWSFMTSWLLKDRVSLVDDDVMCRFFPLLSPAAFFWVAAWRPLFFLLSFLFLIEIRFFPYTTDRRCFWLFLFYSLLRFIIEIFCVGNIAPWLDDAIRTVLLWKLRFRVGSLKKKNIITLINEIIYKLQKVSMSNMITRVSIMRPVSCM